jgi:Bacterial SH3 domain
MNTTPQSNRLSWNFLGLISAMLLILPLTASAQVRLNIDRRVKVHEKPSLAGKRVNGLTPGSSVTLLAGRRGAFFKVRLADGTEGWVHGKYLLLPDIEERQLDVEKIMAAPAPAPPSAPAPAFPMCGPAAHYRWKEKITTSGFTQQPTKPSVNAALGWIPLLFSGHDLLSWCAERSGREKKPFSVLGWVRRTRKEDDGDVHIEVTQNAGDSVNDCFVVEIPAADLSPKFKQARKDLATILSVADLVDQDFNAPKRVRFTGLAFWDGWHATSTLPVKHGRCNSTKGAAWELHPIFKVSPP